MAVKQIGMTDPLPPPFEDIELRELFAALETHARIAIGVSGGADSMALLHLLIRWRDLRAQARHEFFVFTVDHGLRAEASAEAAWVGEVARSAGLNHREQLSQFNIFKWMWQWIGHANLFNRHLAQLKVMGYFF